VSVNHYNREQLNICDTESVLKAIKDSQSRFVVNCSAYTNVRTAESESELANEVNGHAIWRLTKLLKNLDTKFIHISTDYVFDGEKSEPYSTQDKPNPLNAYGKSKLIGEEAVLTNLPDAGFVVRTAWLYGGGSQNFPMRIKSALEVNTDPIQVVNDQHGSPTSCADVAQWLLDLAQSQVSGGIFHATNSGEATWYDFARLVALSNNFPESRITPISSRDFTTELKRPKYSVLKNVDLSRQGIRSLPSWQSAYERSLGKHHEE